MAKARARQQRAKPSKQKAARRAQGERKALESLAEKRRPFEPLLKQIVAAVLHAQGPERAEERDAASEVPEGDQLWVEVGSGLGHLRALLPPEAHNRLTHTELSEWLVRGLLQKYPQARALTASVTRLPFEAGSVDAVLGLCVFDSFAEQARAAQEIARVLRDGGRFIHFLDAATNVEPVLAQLVEAGRLPLPNFLVDIAQSHPDRLDVRRVAHLILPYQDVLSVPFAQFSAVTEVLQRANHPMLGMLQRYLSVFAQQPFDSLAAARAFVRLTSEPAVGRPVNQALTSLYTTLTQPPYSQHLPFELQPHSSLARFKATLERYFSPDFGFHLRMSDIVYARAYEADETDPLRARVRRVGIGQNSADWPAPQGIAAWQLAPELAHLEPTPGRIDQHVLREAAVYCFVAERRVASRA